MFVGMLVGDFVGAFVGFFVGLIVGAFVGLLVGRLVGVLVGRFVGRLEGLFAIFLCENHKSNRIYLLGGRLFSIIPKSRQKFSVSSSNFLFIRGLYDALHALRVERIKHNL